MGDTQAKSLTGIPMLVGVFVCLFACFLFVCLLVCFFLSFFDHCLPLLNNLLTSGVYTSLVPRCRVHV